MKIRNIMLFALPVIALSVGIVALNTPKTSEEYSTVEAADYTPSNRKLTFNDDGSVSATFSVNDNTLDTRGWLLCLFNSDSKPTFDPVTHKINNSKDIHPYTTAGCAHYFFAANTTREGNVSVTWSANFADQKEGWTETEKTTTEEGHKLKDYLADTTKDWYIVVGIRHFNSSWGKYSDQPGEGTDGKGTRGWWENCDYYAGKESAIKGNLPYGEIYLDLTQIDWEKDNAKFGVYFFDENDKNNDDKKVFTDFATEVPSEDGIYIVSYELNFVPTHMIGVRFKSTCTTPNWNDKDNQTEDLTFYRYGVIGVTDWNKGWSDFLATVKIDGVTDEIVLDNYKRNDQDQSEHYNDYIDLKANDEFVIKYHESDITKSKEFYSMDCLDVLKVEGNKHFEIDEANHKIKVLKSGTYSFYFKADVDNGQVFISKPEIAFADVWAKSFLEGIKEEETSCEKTKTNWSSHKDEYDNLPHGAKVFLLNVEHSGIDVEFENYYERAIQRYDYIIYLYGTSTYNDYIGRVNAGKITPRSTFNPIIGAFSSDNSTPIALVVIISVVSLTAVGGYIFLKRRKEN